jgi:hypothetical protein
MSIGQHRFSLFRFVALCIFAGAPLTVSASHSWNGYHWWWDSTSPTVTTGQRLLAIADNTTLSALWKSAGSGSFLIDVIAAWNKGCPNPVNTSGSCSSTTISMPLYLDRQNGNNTSKERKCPPTLGQVDVCDTTYGRNGWLGIASVWVSGSHITQGTVKLNDTYFGMATYNKPEWKNLVLCQELGHTFGLDHQDVNFNNTNLNTCMDYTNLPASNQWPNYHDFDELLNYIYTHNDATSTSTTSSASGKIPPAMANDMNDPSQWGRLVRLSRNGRTAVYELDIGGGHKIFTFVIWA